MMARKNRVSAAITQEDYDKAMDYINHARDFFPFLINLSKIERKTMRKMGSKSVDYVQDCLTGGKQFENSLAKDFPMIEFQKDAVLIRQLFAVALLVNAFAEGLNDTLMALGADCMAESDEVYATLKRAATKDANAKSLVDQISKRFAGQGKKKTVKQP
jgi:hypothetical protein